jgi:L-asparagine oxygenase
MSILEVVRNRGYLFLEQFYPDRSHLDAVSLIGKPVTLGSCPALHALTPTDQDKATPNTYSGMFGRAAFPFHTDLAHWRRPPRYVLLRCEVGFEDVPTLVIDGREVADKAGRDIVSRALVQPRRPIRGKLPLLNLMQSVDGNDLIRWDEIFVRPASDNGKAGMSAFSRALDACDPKAISLVRRGDTLILDNWRMLHARAPVGKEHASRRILRAYLEDLS